MKPGRAAGANAFAKICIVCGQGREMCDVHGAVTYATLNCAPLVEC